MAHSNSLNAQLAAQLGAWEAAGLRRELPDLPDRSLVDFVSNDYLGLSAHPALSAAAHAASLSAGSGGRAARLLGGGSEHHARAERAMAAWIGAEAALLFPSGYQANVSAIAALVERDDVLLSDAKNHASIIDGARLSRATVRVHAHLNLDELEEQLAESQAARRRLVVTEGVFSMDGDAPDLLAMAALCERYAAWLLVDEAHSIGLLGAQGAGASAAAALGGNLVRVLPCGKALGVGGAFVAGSQTLREHLIHRARGFVFSTAPQPALAATLEAAIELARQAQDGRARLAALGQQLARGLGLPDPIAAIVPYRTGTPGAALTLSKACQSLGLDVRAVRPPTVPEGESGLRIVLHANNTEAEVERLIAALKASAPANGAAQRSERAGQALLAARGTDSAASLQEIASAGTERKAQRSGDAQALFVVGTDTDIGKTLISALLLRAARALGPALYWKPVQTGTELDTLAVGRMAEAADTELGEPLWSLPLPASPHAAASAAELTIDPRRLDEALLGIRRELPATRLIIELAGGLLVPYSIDPVLETQADWLQRERASLVLVARSGLGTLNHTLLTLEALRSRNLEPRALFLVGEPHASNRETLARISGINVIFGVETLVGLKDNPGAVLDAWLARHDLSPIWKP